MKTLYYLFALLCLCASCNNSNKKETEVTTDKNEAVSTNTVNSETKDTQKGDYSTLYNRSKNDCRIVEASEIAGVLGIPEQNVNSNYTVEGLCKYDITLADGSTSLYMITAFDIPQRDVTREVENYEAGKGGLQHYKSDNGDVDLCIHPYQGWLFLYNTSYNNAVKISFGSALQLKDLNKEQKEKRKTNALKLANFIVEKYQN